MLKNVILVVLVVLLLAMGGVLLAPRLGLTLTKKPFDPPAIANEIILDVGASSVSTGLLCGSLEGLGSGADGFTCQQNRYSATEARDRIDKIVGQYRAKAGGEWNITEAGFTRFYGHPNPEAIEAIGQSVVVMVTSDVVLVSYNE